MIPQVTDAFSKKFGKLPESIVHAPGRVNLIGEHTDYNNGFVLPMAIDRGIWIALQPRNDLLVRLYSQEFSEPADFSLDNLSHKSGWGEYVRGMAWVLSTLGYPLSGWEGVLVSNLPIASGLSSSAALELATARAFWSVTPWEWNSKEMALAAQKMENNWLNLNSGAMDQLASSCGKKGHALLIDCLDLTIETVPFPEGVSIVVMDTGVQRGLIDSAYNQRVLECKKASSHFGVKSLRDLNMETLKENAPVLDPIIFRRARHVVSENQRAQQAAMAMRNSDLECLAELINRSHASLRDDYQVSSAELDSMVEIATSHPACSSARMTGAGFGGCAIAVVKKSGIEDFIFYAKNQHQEIYNFQPLIFKTDPASGVQ